MFLQCPYKTQMLNKKESIGEFNIDNRCLDPECHSCLNAIIEEELGDLDKDIAMQTQ